MRAARQGEVSRPQAPLLEKLKELATGLVGWTSVGIEQWWAVHGTRRYAGPSATATNRRVANPRATNPRALAAVAAALILCAGWACGNGSVDPGTLHFGQVGEVEVSLATPLHGAVGQQRQHLTWESGGAWRLFEEIAYQGEPGDETTTPNPGVPELFASSYASFINGVNTDVGWRLFNVVGVDSSGSDPEPECAVAESRLTFVVRDAGRNDEARWSHCASGTLRSLRVRSGERDNTAARVIQAVIIMRNLTIGEADDTYAYTGSWPFATVEKGDDTGLELDQPQVFRSSDGAGSHAAPSGWESAWTAHARGAREPPEVDWATEMVLVGAIGIREESGDSVEIRRVLHLGTERGTEIKIVERVPGDFCAPVHKVVRPFHIVVAPRAPAPVFFSEPQIEKSPCGGV